MAKILMGKSSEWFLLVMTNILNKLIWNMKNLEILGAKKLNSKLHLFEIIYFDVKSMWLRNALIWKLINYNRVGGG